VQGLRDGQAAATTRLCGPGDGGRRHSIPERVNFGWAEQLSFHETRAVAAGRVNPETSGLNFEADERAPRLETRAKGALRTKAVLAAKRRIPHSTAAGLVAAALADSESKSKSGVEVLHPECFPD
jgi:hypothetical protein